MAPFKRREVLGLRQSERLRVFLISRLQKWRWPVMLSTQSICTPFRSMARWMAA